jgi:hypothetical protein
MPSILASNALTTLAAVNDELALTSDSGGAQDQRVERYINEASAAFASFCGRVFEHDDAIVENVKSRGSHVLRVTRRPLVEVTSIVIDDAEVDPEDFVSDEAAGTIYRATPWPDTAVRERTITQGRRPGSEDASRIVVTYAGGFLTPAQVAVGGVYAGETRTLPYDLEGACIRMAASRWRRRGTDVAVATENGQNAGRSFHAGPFPPEVLAVLAAYRVFAHA